MAEVNEDSVLSALEGAFGDVPAAPKAAPVQAPVAQPAPLEADGSEVEEIEIPSVEGDEPEPVEQQAADAPEPEFEIEVNGQKEVVRGADKVKELLQKGLHYSRGSEEVARVREQLAAQARIQQAASQFQQSALADIAELRALDGQLAEYNKIDWATAIDTDFVGVMKLQEKRNQLKEARNAKIQELNTKQQQFEQGQAEAAQQMLAAEEAALFAKLPSWRNSEVATAEKQSIRRTLMQEFGYQASEVEQLMDHRALLLARAASKWIELQKTKTDKTKLLRDAPPVIKPGAANAQQKPNERATFGKFVQDFRQQGRKGNHRSQEAALEKLLSRTFK